MAKKEHFFSGTVEVEGKSLTAFERAEALKAKLNASLKSEGKKEAYGLYAVKKDGQLTGDIVVARGTGTGKEVVAVHLGYEVEETKAPVVSVQPKTAEDYLALLASASPEVQAQVKAATAAADGKKPSIAPGTKGRQAS